MGRPKKPAGEKWIRTSISLPSEMAEPLRSLAVERYARGQRDGLSGAIRELAQAELARRARRQTKPEAAA